MITNINEFRITEDRNKLSKINESMFYTVKDDHSIYRGDLFKIIQSDWEKLPNEVKLLIKPDTEYELIGSGGSDKSKDKKYYVVEDPESLTPIIIPNKQYQISKFITPVTCGRQG